MICNEAVAVLKEYNLRRHYQSKHQANYSKLEGKPRAEKFAKLQHQLLRGVNSLNVKMQMSH